MDQLSRIRWRSQRVDVLPDRKPDTVSTWLREHPGVEIVCRDGSAAYAEAIRQGAPEAVQVSDRWHHNPDRGRRHRRPAHPADRARP